MANKAGSQAPFIIVFGGDAYLNKRTGRDLIRRALHDRPDAERIDLDATGCDQYAFDEAVSPSLLADVAVVVVDNLQNADDKLGESMVRYCRQACADPGASSIVILMRADRYPGAVEHAHSAGVRRVAQLLRGRRRGVDSELGSPARAAHQVLHHELGHGGAADVPMAYEHDSVHPWTSSHISGFPQVINAVRMSSPSRGIPNRLVYERIFSAAIVVKSVVNLADLQLRTL